MPLPNHFFVATGSGYGHLYDTRLPDWSRQPPLREKYCYTARTIATTADLRATLRNGAYAWPGGYPLYFVTSDGAALSFATVRRELRAILDSIQNSHNDGWRVIGVDVNYEDTELTDDRTGEPIESAYRD